MLELERPELAELERALPLPSGCSLHFTDADGDKVTLRTSADLALALAHQPHRTLPLIEVELAAAAPAPAARAASEAPTAAASGGGGGLPALAGALLSAATNIGLEAVSTSGRLRHVAASEGIG